MSMDMTIQQLVHAIENEIGCDVSKQVFGIYNVKCFGAKGDGYTDDTNAIQAAINAAQNQPNGVVYLPPNATSQSYKTTAPLVISRPIRFVGAGPMGTTILGSGMSAGQAVLHVDGTITPNLEFVEVSNLTLMSNNDVPDLLKVNRASNSVFRDIGLRNCRYGVVLTADRTFSNLFERVIYTTGAMTRTLAFDRYTGGGQLTFVGCNFGGTYGVTINNPSDVSGLTFLGCNFEGTAQEAFYANGDVYGLSFFGCRFEKNQGTAQYADININPDTGKAAFGITVTGCFFETDAASYAIAFGGTGGAVRGFNICGNYAQHYSGAFVRLNGEGQSGIVAGNRLTGLPSAVNVVRPGVLVINNETAAVAIEPTWNPTTATQQYAVINPCTDRTLDVSGDTTAQVAAVLGTLIADLQAIGLIKA